MEESEQIKKEFNYKKMTIFAFQVLSFLFLCVIMYLVFFMPR